MQKAKYLFNNLVKNNKDFKYPEFIFNRVVSVMHAILIMITIKNLTNFSSVYSDYAAALLFTYLVVLFLVEGAYTVYCTKNTRPLFVPAIKPQGVIGKTMFTTTYIALLCYMFVSVAKTQWISIIIVSYISGFACALLNVASSVKIERVYGTTSR